MGKAGEIRIEIGRTPHGTEYVEAAAAHARYGYETADGERFALWDARRAPGRVPVMIGAPDGAIARIGAMTVAHASDHWRALRVGTDRVLVDMTPALARVQAIEMIDTALQDPEGARAVKATWPSRDAALADLADAIMVSGVAAVATVTAGLLRAFEIDPPDVPDMEADAAELFDRWCGGGGPTAGDCAVEVAIATVQVTYHARSGDVITEDAWQQMAHDPRYVEVCRTKIKPPGAGDVPIAFELVTQWQGIALDGDRSYLFRTGVRLVHECGRPECVSGKLQALYSAATEAAALEVHDGLWRTMLADTDGAGRTACRMLASYLNEEGLDHFPDGMDLPSELQRHRAMKAAMSRRPRGAA